MEINDLRELADKTPVYLFPTGSRKLYKQVQGKWILNPEKREYHVCRRKRDRKWCNCVQTSPTKHNAAHKKNLRPSTKGITLLVVHRCTFILWKLEILFWSQIYWLNWITLKLEESPKLTQTMLGSKGISPRNKKKNKRSFSVVKKSQHKVCVLWWRKMNKTEIRL